MTAENVQYILKFCLLMPKKAWADRLLTVDYMMPVVHWFR